VLNFNPNQPNKIREGKKGMLIWCIILLLLGFLTYLDNFLMQGEIFRGLHPLLFILVALGLLIRTSIKQKEGQIERYVERIKRLEEKVQDLLESRSR
jgi:hypothetical protein